MYNWSTVEKNLKKNNKIYSIWKIEQMVNFGLDGDKIKTSQIKKYWKFLKIDPFRRKLLKLLLHGNTD